MFTVLFFLWFYSQFSYCHLWNLLSVCGWGCGFYLIPWASAYAFPCQVTSCFIFSCRFSNVSCIYFYLCVITLISAPLPSLPLVYLKRQLVSALSQSVCLPQLCEFLFIAPFLFLLLSSLLLTIIMKVGLSVFKPALWVLPLVVFLLPVLNFHENRYDPVMS